jgi:hypothetical protein
MKIEANRGATQVAVPARRSRRLPLRWAGRRRIVAWGGTLSSNDRFLARPAPKFAHIGAADSFPGAGHGSTGR